MARWHEVLGVREDAPAAEVQAAFRRLLLQHHPDRHPGDPAAMERFRAVHAAHQEWQAREGKPLPSASPEDQEANARVLENVLAAMSTPAEPKGRAGAVLLYGVLALILLGFLVLMLGGAGGPF